MLLVAKAKAGVAVHKWDLVEFEQKQQAAWKEGAPRTYLLILSSPESHEMRHLAYMLLDNFKNFKKHYYVTL